MRVLIDFTGPMGADAGGATYARYMLPRWERTHDEVLALFSNGQVLPELSSLASARELPASSLPGPLGKVFDLHRRLGEELRRGSHDVAFFPHSIVALGPKQVPTAVAIRSTLHLHYPGQLSFARRHYRRLATHRTVRGADLIVVPSSALADDLMRFTGAPRRKIVVIPHGIDLEQFRPDAGVEASPNRFLFVSKPYDYKGLATLLRAFARFRRMVERSDETELRVVDGGVAPVDPGVGPRALRPGYGREMWESLAARLGVSSDVQFLGRLSHDQLRGEYQQASALVAPTSIESFGHPFVEAAACGCPVIVSSGHGIDETIGPVAIQVPAHSHDEIASAMAACAGMTPGERAQRSAELRAWAERFSWDRTLAETRAAMAEIAA